MIFVNVKTLITVVLFLEQARGRRTLLAGDLVPAGITLVTPALKSKWFLTNFVSRIASSTSWFCHNDANVTQ